MCGKKGKCIECAWHLRKEEWCLPKGVWISNPHKERPCKIYQTKGTEFPDNVKGTKK